MEVQRGLQDLLGDPEPVPAHLRLGHHREPRAPIFRQIIDPQRSPGDLRRGRVLRHAEKDRPLAVKLSKPWRGLFPGALQAAPVDLRGKLARRNVVAEGRIEAPERDEAAVPQPVPQQAREQEHAVPFRGEVQRNKRTSPMSRRPVIPRQPFVECSLAAPQQRMQGLVQIVVVVDDPHRHVGARRQPVLDQIDHLTERRPGLLRE